MKIMVIGAGVVGITTAWSLLCRGHDVTVVDALEGPALETSRANAGQRSYGYVYPWADPGLIQTGLRGLFSAYGPLKIPFPWSLHTVDFLWRTTRYAFTRGVYATNHHAMLELGAYSRECFLNLERDVPLSFDGGHDGLMEIVSQAHEMSDLAAKAKALEALGIEHEWLTPDDVRTVEPGLSGQAEVAGALRLPGDGTGDCRQFTRELASLCKDRGCRFQYSMEVADWELRNGRLVKVGLRPTGGESAQLQHEAVDQVVLCAGCASRDLGGTLGLKLPIYPVKGYSLTAPITHPERAPRSTVADHSYRVAMTRLGERVRVTGFVELADFRRSVPERRLRVLREAIQARFPDCGDFSLAESWTGFRPMTPDGPAILGPSRIHNLLLNTGHGTFGWTLSAGSAEIIGQLVDGERPALDLTPFRGERFSQRG